MGRVRWIIALISHLDLVTGMPRTLVSAWMRHKGDALAEKHYVGHELLDVRPRLDRLPPLAIPFEEGRRVLARVLARKDRERCKKLRTDETTAVEQDAREVHANDANPLQDADEQHLDLVGERGLEPPTRSTQSYASTN